jgi:hypothetical protein
MVADFGGIHYGLSFATRSMGGPGPLFEIPLTHGRPQLSSLSLVFLREDKLLRI